MFNLIYFHRQLLPLKGREHTVSLMALETASADQTQQLRVATLVENT